MMDSDKRQVLIDYRLERAVDDLETARLLLDRMHFHGCANRAYYAMFHAVSALALRYEFKTSKHKQLIGWFNQTFAATGAAEPRYAKLLHNAFAARSRGDYEDLVSFTPEEVSTLVTHAGDFIAEARRLLIVSAEQENTP